MQYHNNGNSTSSFASKSNPPNPPATTNNKKANGNSNEQIQSQIRSEIQRFESVHPCIYRIYNLLDEIEDSIIANRIRQQVINIEDAFVNSQEWTLSRAINEIKLGVIGSGNSCKNSLIHFFLTANWNWEDAPEGGRFKKKVVVDGRNYLLLIRDEGSRQPNFQFVHWLDALLIVFTVESRDSFQHALNLCRLVNNYRQLDADGVPVYLVAMKNMSNPGLERSVNDEEAQKIAKAQKLTNYFECLNERSVLKLFDLVCQQIDGRWHRSRPSTAISKPFEGFSHFQDITSENLVGANNSTSSSTRPSSCHYQHTRSISMLPSSSHNSNTNSSSQQINSLRHTDDVASQQNHHHCQPTSFRTHYSFQPNNMVSTPEKPFVDRRRESLDPSQWHRLSTTPFALPTTPSCSVLFGGGRNNTPFGDRTVDGGISPALSQNSLSNNQCQFTRKNNDMAIDHYARSSSNFFSSSSSSQRPISNPPNQQHYFPRNNNEPFFVDLLTAEGQKPLSTATSSSTLTFNQQTPLANFPTPGSTPKTERKGKRISNIFRKEHVQTPDERSAKSSAEIHMGIGRAIPIRQGQLYKRSKNGLNKEWKKKYVCLYPDGRICYHQNLKDYMDKDSRGKEIYLGLATVRTSDRHKPKVNNRNSLFSTQHGGRDNQCQQQPGYQEQSNEPSIAENEDLLKSPTAEYSEGVSDTCGTESGVGGGLIASTSSSALVAGAEREKQQIKKERNKKKKKMAKNDEDDECCEFEVVSCDQKRWEFSAPSMEDRDQWVACIAGEIEKCLQKQLSLKDQRQLDDNVCGPANNKDVERRRANIQALRLSRGNDRCADCGAINPDWASINLGTLICIECSGIHRKLGSHISKVRSLELDDWPPEHLVVMQAIGNHLANEIWEHNASQQDKPTPETNREQKERWIKQKYEEKIYLPPIPVDRTLNQQLVEAVLGRDIKQLLTVLPRCNTSDINATIGGSTDKRTAIHLACGISAPEILQLLIWYKADIWVLDERGHSALWYAQMNGANECLTILSQSGLGSEERITDDRKSWKGEF